MEVISLNVGKPVTVDYRGKPLETGIYKLPAEGPVRLHAEGFDGDGQADLVNHGGVNRAVCVYPIEHYTFWEEHLGKQLAYSAFGENITVSGLLETEVCIGDVYEIGTALLQVSQPRFRASSFRRSMARMTCRPRCCPQATAAFISAYCVKARLVPAILLLRSSPVRVTTQ